MRERVWNGERDRPLGAYRPCPCSVCSQNRHGVGYLSHSSPLGRGFTIWIEDERVFQALSRALQHAKWESTAGTEEGSA